MIYFLLGPKCNETTAGPGPLNGFSVTAQGSFNHTSPPVDAAFVLSVDGIGAVSATAQVLGTNDPPSATVRHWVPIGDAITASGTNTGSISASNMVPYRHYGAYLSALSGTGAVAQLTMSA